MLQTNKQSRQSTFRKPLYGQLIIGPPGSGKTTYCRHAYNFYKELERNVAIVNLDPANDNMEYSASVDVMQLITVLDVMEHSKLGPNGSLLYCAEYLEEHFEDWLLDALNKCAAKNINYFLFDCPGQIELYTHHSSMANIFKRLQTYDFNLVTVNLIDCHYCSDPTKFVSMLLMALNMMMRMEMPHINVLSKADLLQEKIDKLHFSLDFYTDVLDLKYLLDALDYLPEKYHKLNAAICSTVEDYALVSFQLLDSRSTHSLLRLRKHIDKANGYVYQAGEEKAVNALMACAVGAESQAKREDEDFNQYLN